MIDEKKAGQGSGEKRQKPLTAEQLEDRFFYVETVSEELTDEQLQQGFSITVDEFKRFLESSNSYIVGLDSSLGELHAEVLCLYQHAKHAHQTFDVFIKTSAGVSTDNQNLILGDRDFIPYMARRGKMPILLIDLVDFTLLEKAEQLRAIIALRTQVMKAYKTYQVRAKEFAGSPVIKFHSVGDGFYILFGQSEQSTPAVKFGQIIYEELRGYNLGKGLFNKVYYRMVAHHGECNILGGIEPIGGVSAIESVFIGEIFNDCDRILSSCPRTEANLLYATEAAYDYYNGDRGKRFSELRIATDKNNKKHNYHIVLPDEHRAE